MNELVKALVSQLGVTSDQAAKGSGLLFKAAKERLGGDFHLLDGITAYPSRLHCARLPWTALRRALSSP